MHAMQDFAADASRVADVAVIGAGPAGLAAGIAAARLGNRVVVFESNRRPGLKLIASGGGRCNLTNTLSAEALMERFGRGSRASRFMGPALERLDQRAIRRFFSDIGVESHAPDGFRVWPKTHRATTVQAALVRALEESGACLRSGCRVRCLQPAESDVFCLDTGQGLTRAACVIVATGGLGYPSLGSTGDGFQMAEMLGHRLLPLHPGMLGLYTEERWPARCTAHTLPKVEVRVTLKKHRHVCATGDLIFSKGGITGPVIKDLSRDITPLLSRYGKVPLVVKLTHVGDEGEWRRILINAAGVDPGRGVGRALEAYLPQPVVDALCEQVGLSPDTALVSVSKRERAALVSILYQTPLTAVGSPGWAEAMVTRGGVALNQVCAETLESRVCEGLFFAGEILDLDGPCGGFNLTWAFSSGTLAGESAAACANSRIGGPRDS